MQSAKTIAATVDPPFLAALENAGDGSALDFLQTLTPHR
jgi:hypothetical protein